MTNSYKNEFEIGCTPDIYSLVHETGLMQRQLSKRDTYCGYLVYWCSMNEIEKAIKYQTELEKMPERKLKQLVTSFNREWRWLNNEIMEMNNFVFRDNTSEE